MRPNCLVKCILFGCLCLVVSGCSHGNSSKNQIPAIKTAQPLAQLLLSTEEAIYELESPFAGTSRVTFRSGYFKEHPDPETKENDELIFDQFEICKKPSPLWDAGKYLARSAGNGAISHLIAHREPLPTDAELASVTKVSELRKMFGRSQGFKNGWDGNSSESWAFFRMTGSDEIETLSIACFTIRRGDDPEWHVKSLEIRRGTAKAARRATAP